MIHVIMFIILIHFKFELFFCSLSIHDPRYILALPLYVAFSVYWVSLSMFFYYIGRGHLNMEIDEIGSGSVKTLEGIFFNLM